MFCSFSHNAPNNVSFHRFLLSSTSGSPAAEEMGAARKLDMTIKSLPSFMFIVIIVCRGIKVNLQKVGNHQKGSGVEFNLAQDVLIALRELCHV